MSAIEVVEGWTGPLDFQLLLDGAPADLTGLTITLVLTGTDGVAVDATGDVSVTDAALGKVRYTPDGADLVNAKSPYKGRWKAVDGTGAAVFFPNSAADLWRVYAP